MNCPRIETGVAIKDVPITSPGAPHAEAMIGAPSVRAAAMVIREGRRERMGGGEGKFVSSFQHKEYTKQFCVQAAGTRFICSV